MNLEAKKDKARFHRWRSQLFDWTDASNSSGYAQSIRLGRWNFGREFSTSISHARTLQISEDRVYSSLDALVEGEKCLPASERMAVVAVLSPNSLHFEAAERLLVEGFPRFVRSL